MAVPCRTRIALVASLLLGEDWGQILILRVSTLIWKLGSGSSSLRENSYDISEREHGQARTRDSDRAVASYHRSGQSLLTISRK